MITYNHELYIKESIIGVMAQITNFEIELIVADDCSTDKTESVVREIINTHPKSNIVEYSRHITNRGMMPNFIWAIEQCKGKYIAICEGDDYWTDPYKLQKQVDLMEQYPEASMCVALNEQFYQNKSQYTKDKPYKGKHYPLIYGLTDLNQYFHTSTYLIRKTTLDIIIKTYRQLILGDTAIRYLTISQGPFVVLNDYVSVYRISGEGVWTHLSEFNKELYQYQLFKKFRKEFIAIQFNNHLTAEIKSLRKLIQHCKNNNLIKDKHMFKLKYIYLIFRFQPKIILKQLARKFKPNNN